jgi:hypothetical protein
MVIIRNIEDNIVVIYEIKSFYVTLAVENFFQIIYIKQITILFIVKNWKKPIILPYHRWVVLGTVKDLKYNGISIICGYKLLIINFRNGSIGRPTKRRHYIHFSFFREDYIFHFSQPNQRRSSIHIWKRRDYMYTACIFLHRILLWKENRSGLNVHKQIFLACFPSIYPHRALT